MARDSNIRIRSLELEFEKIEIVEIKTEIPLITVSNFKLYYQLLDLALVEILVVLAERNCFVILSKMYQILI